MGARRETVANGTTGAVAAEDVARVHIAPPRAMLARLDPGADAATTALVLPARVLVAPVMTRSAGRDDDDSLDVGEKTETLDGIRRVTVQEIAHLRCSRLLCGGVRHGDFDHQLTPVGANDCGVTALLTSDEGVRLRSQQCDPSETALM